VIDETDSADVSLLERRANAPDRLVIVETTAERPVLVEPPVDRLVLVEPLADEPGQLEAPLDAPRVESPVELAIVVPAMRDGEADVATVPMQRTPLPLESVPQLQIGPFQISDLSQVDVVSAIISGTMAARDERAWVTYALHVGGLNRRRDNSYLDAMSRADLVYADGMSIIVLAKLAGARAAERAGTTDIGWDVMRELSLALGRPARVALIGGPDGLTRRAAAVIEAEVGAEVVLAEHGYHDDWAPVLDQLANSGCDMVLVGLGAPWEMKWVDKHVNELPPCLVMTCGGWFGFITQDEKRAPHWLCSAGLEWTYRLAQSPKRLFSRYAKGALSTAVLAIQVVRTRSRPA
jgi:N-acetylglucosaminyldiphosphoundecaprenol N-acetyl-beta-D-mannosaminyltransferase